MCGYNPRARKSKRGTKPENLVFNGVLVITQRKVHFYCGEKNFSFDFPLLQIVKVYKSFFKTKVLEFKVRKSKSNSNKEGNHEEIEPVKLDSPIDINLEKKINEELSRPKNLEKMKPKSLEKMKSGEGMKSELNNNSPVEEEVTGLSSLKTEEEESLEKNIVIYKFVNFNNNDRDFCYVLVSDLLKANLKNVKQKKRETKTKIENQKKNEEFEII